MTSPDSPLASSFVAAHPTRYCTPGQAGSGTCQNLASPRPINRIVIHSLAVPGDSVESGVQKVVRAWQNPGRQASSHYLVDRDGTITQMVLEANVAFHTPGANADSIGIEHADVCNEPDPLTTELYEQSAALVRDIAGFYGFTPDSSSVAGHDTVAGNHDDPGPYWDWEYYYSLLAWDGQTLEDRPIRLVARTTDLAASPAGWSSLDRTQVLNEGQPIPNDHCATRNHAYSAEYLLTQPDPSGVPVEFTLIVDEFGLYSVSLYWPNVKDANPATQVEIEAQCLSSPCTDAFFQSVEMNQSPNYGRWNDTGANLTVTNPPVEVRVRICADSSQPGWILADAMRVLKVGSV